MMSQLSPKAGHDAGDARLRSANVRTALVLASIAAVFFIGIVVAKFIGDTTTGMSVLGAAVLLFLVLAIGRNLRK
ncbi:MAG: cytochrome oxidase small assembly protein [Casimicrobiaceae bacterium]